jgi:hypothetical protein
MATVESLLVHARSLMDFFCPAEGYESDSRRQDRIFASDFCATWTPKRWESFKADWNAISEEIMHLTYRRPEIGSNWPYQELLRKVNVQLSRFLENEDRLHPHQKIQLRGVLAGKRTSIAYTSAVDDAMWAIDPAVLSGLNATGSIPTTALTEPWLITETPQ